MTVSPTNEDAARQVAAGNARAFHVIVDSCGSRLYRTLCRLLGDPAQAEDTLQDVFVRAFVALQTGRFQGEASVFTWIYRIAVNAATDVLRTRRTRQDRLADRTLDERRGQMDGQVEARQALLRLEALVAALPAEQRVALILREVEGLSSRETADALGISEGAVEQRLVRARATLRERMKDHV